MCNPPTPQHMRLSALGCFPQSGQYYVLWGRGDTQSGQYYVLWPVGPGRYTMWLEHDLFALLWMAVDLLIGHCPNVLALKTWARTLFFMLEIKLIESAFNSVLRVPPIWIQNGSNISFIKVNGLSLWWKCVFFLSTLLDLRISDEISTFHSGFLTSVSAFTVQGGKTVEVTDLKGTWGGTIFLLLFFLWICIFKSMVSSH